MFLKGIILFEFGLLHFPELKNTLHCHPANIYIPEKKLPKLK